MPSMIGMFYFTVKEVGTGVALESLNYKSSCISATTFSIDVNFPANFNIDGKIIQQGQRILVRAQTIKAENGIYIRQGNSFVRSSDCDSWEEMIMGLVFVESGSTYKGTSWLLYVERGGILEIDDIEVIRYPMLKTINGQSIHGDGDITVSGAMRGVAVFVSATEPVDKQVNDVWIKI